jgi:alkylation response protein AidB-like acyl-CoA dehydrogenase
MNPLLAGLDERIARLLAAYDARRGPDAAFRGLQFDLGLAWADRPIGEGGIGAEPHTRAIVDDALAEAGIPENLLRSGIGVPLVAPTLAAFGTEEQRHKFLRPIFTGSEAWCQLFSEPNAGSDIASLSTRAVRSGSDWIVNGQKVWTSFAHVARWGILCARTDPNVPKHQGLTYFILDMRAKGVEIRPLRQITGEAEFSEVFLTDVVVPDERRVGEVGGGWQVTMATLANERAAGGHGETSGPGSPLARLIEIWQERGALNAHLRDRVLELAVRAETIRLAVAETSALEAQGVPSSAWSYLKMVTTELDKEILDLALTLMGPEGMTFGSYAMQVRDSISGIGEGDVQRAYLFARGMTIAGGTSEVQRTIIADRVLGLPREPQLDRDLPWRDIGKNR